MRDPLYLYGDEPYEENENVILIPKELVFTEAFATYERKEYKKAL